MQVAQAIAAFENVTVGAPPDQLAAVRAQLPPGVAVAAIPQDDAWFRDTGPTVGGAGRVQLGACRVAARIPSLAGSGKGWATPWR